MLYVYRRQPSESAVRLAASLRDDAIDAKKVRKLPRRWRGGDKVVCWGDDPGWAVPDDPYIPVLNGFAALGKFDEAVTLAAAGIPVVQVSRYRPVAEREMWLGRMSNHHGGNDLLADYGFDPSYWVYREQIVREYRLHIFDGVSIRAGRKEPFRDGHHPWVRSYAAGWHIVYDGRGVTDKHRGVAKAAVAALGLTFGAVDVGEREDGSVIVFEVNRAPGVEGNTVVAYRDAIVRWANER